MVAAPSVKSHKRSAIQGKKQGKEPKTTLNARINPGVEAQLDEYADNAGCSKSQVTESLLRKAFVSPNWIEIDLYEQLPVGRHAYVIFDSANALVEMGLAENLHQEIAQHPKLEQYVADQCKVIYFAAQ